MQISMKADHWGTLDGEVYFQLVAGVTYDLADDTAIAAGKALVADDLATEIGGAASEPVTPPAPATPAWTAALPPKTLITQPAPVTVAQPQSAPSPVVAPPAAPPADPA